MTLGFIETRKFMALREQYFDGDTSYSAFQQTPLNSPEAGSVMPGCDGLRENGLREIRWPDPRRGKGKRGGLRVIYLHVPEAQIILFVKVYDKDEADDLTADQQKALAQAARELREAVLQRNQRRN